MAHVPKSTPPGTASFDTEIYNSWGGTFSVRSVSAILYAYKKRGDTISLR